MRNVALIATLIVLLSQTFSCDPPRPKMTGSLNIAFYVSDTNQKIYQGDTLTISFAVPQKLNLGKGEIAFINSILMDPPIPGNLYKDLNCTISISNNFIADKGFARYAKFIFKGVLKDSFRYEAKFVAKDTGSTELEIYIDGFIKAKTDKGDLNINYIRHWAVDAYHIELLELNCPKMKKEPYYSEYRNKRHYAFRVVP